MLSRFVTLRFDTFSCKSMNNAQYLVHVCTRIWKLWPIERPREGGKKERVMGICHNLICVQGSQNLEGKLKRSLLSLNLQPDKVFPPCHIIWKLFMHILLEIIYTIQRFHCIMPKKTGRNRRQKSSIDVQCSVIWSHAVSEIKMCISEVLKNVSNQTCYFSVLCFETETS